MAGDKTPVSKTLLGEAARESALQVSYLSLGAKNSKFRYNGSALDQNLRLTSTLHNDPRTTAALGKAKFGRELARILAIIVVLLAGHQVPWL